MKNLHAVGETTRFYRRGTIMGLTVAETFILLVFALLLLLLLMWDELAEKNDALKESESRQKSWGVLTNDPNSESLLVVIKNLPPEGRKFLSDFMTRDNPLKLLEEAVALDESLVDPAAIRKLVGIDPNLQQKLGEWMISSDFAEVIRSSDEVTELVTSGYDLKQLIKQLDSDSLISTEVAEGINKKIGEIVRRFGGEIGPNGVISVPSTKSFASGEATLTVEFKDFLTDFCPKYLQELHQHQSFIRDIRIEGHASSEWSASNSIQERFLNNLDLSQRRAYAVLSHCLKLLENDNYLFEWATKKITAVGFSSARPILNRDNKEDKERSRRVDFSYIINHNMPNFGIRSTND